MLKIDQEHLAGLKAPLADDLGLRNRQHTLLRTHDDHVVIGDAVARWAQTIAVKRGANLTTVRKHNRCGAVPRLHHRRVVLIKRAAALVHLLVLLPWLGDHHHDRLRDGVARHGQQLKTVVKCCRVGLIGETDGVKLFKIVTQDR